MDPDELDDEMNGRFRLPGQARGECPRTDDLIAFAGGEQPAGSSTEIEAHVELCAVCESLVDRLREPETQPGEFTWKRAERELDRRPAPWRPRRPAWQRYSGLVAAGMALVIAPVVWMARNPESEPPALRGSAIQLVEPSGQIDQLDQFRWQALPAYTSFRIRLERDGQIIREVSTSEPRYVPDDAAKKPVVSGAKFRWQVQGLDDQGRVIDESAWLAFDLRP